MEFQSWPKTPRLFRDIVITEKIDGTNSAVLIEQASPGWDDDEPGFRVHGDDVVYRVQAQSRNRLITPGKTTDNYGFAAWVYEHAGDLVRALGPGRHFGEWWGQGIARGYHLDEKRFSLFNPDFEFGEVDKDVSARLSPRLGTVPELARGVFSEGLVEQALDILHTDGSVAAPGFERPEGIVVYHTAARQGFKVLLENDELPKGVVENPATAARMNWRSAEKLGLNGSGL